MKVTTVLIALVGATSVVQAGGVGKAIKGIFSRDPEFARAVLEARDRTIKEWQQAVANPSTISPEMMSALKAQGFKPPPGTKTKRGPSPAKGNSIPKKEALAHVSKGNQIPQPVLQSMASKGWSGPKLGSKSKRDVDEIYAREAEAIAEEISNFARDLESAIFARDAEADFEERDFEERDFEERDLYERDLFERDAYPEAYFEERDLFERDAYPEAYFEERDALPESYFYERDAIPEPYFFERDAEAVESY
ncbi:MAG: hypothetical protein Q9187_003027 [Circinaria calcarea]